MLSEEYKKQLQKLAGIVSERVFLISFDRGSVSNSVIARKRVMEFILSKNDGNPLTCPVETTIVFHSPKNYEYWMGKTNNSEVLNGIHFILVEIHPPGDPEELIGQGDWTLRNGFENVKDEVKAALARGESFKDVL